MPREALLLGLIKVFSFLAAVLLLVGLLIKLLPYLIALAAIVIGVKLIEAIDWGGLWARLPTESGPDPPDRSPHSPRPRRSGKSEPRPRPRRRRGFRRRFHGDPVPSKAGEDFNP